MTGACAREAIKLTRVQQSKDKGGVSKLVQKAFQALEILTSDASALSRDRDCQKKSHC